MHFVGSRMNLIAKFLKDESAATAIEYGLIAAGIALATILSSPGSAPTSRPRFRRFQPRLAKYAPRPRPVFRHA